MGYNANVRATFDPRRFGKQASTAAVAFTFYTSIALSRESDPFLAYILLFASALIVAAIHFVFTTSKGRPGINILAPNDSLQIRRLFLPLLYGVITVTIAGFLLVSLTAPPWGPGSPGAKTEVIIFLILAALAEEFRFRFVDMQIFPYAPFTANAFFVLLHPQVSRIFSLQPPDFLFAFFAFFFGFVMLAVTWLYEIPMRRGLNRGFGIVYAVVVHAGYNALVTIWSVSIAGFDLFPM